MRCQTNESLFSHNGSVLFNTLDGNVSLSTFPANEPVHTLHVSPVATTTLDLDPRGRFVALTPLPGIYSPRLMSRYLAAGSNDALLTLWETRDWTCVRSMGFHE
jgi:THO complex subunit 3